MLRRSQLASVTPYRAAQYSFFVQPTTQRGRPRGPRAHTRFDLSTALPVVKKALAGARVAVHTSPRHGTHRPATCRYLTGFAQADEEPPRSRRLDSTSRRPATTGRRALLPPPHRHHRQARASSDAPTKRPHGAQAIGTKPRHIGLTTFQRHISDMCLEKNSSSRRWIWLLLLLLARAARGPRPRTSRPRRTPSPATARRPPVRGSLTRSRPRAPSSRGAPTTPDSSSCRRCQTASGRHPSPPSRPKLVNLYPFPKPSWTVSSPLPASTKENDGP